MKEQTTMKNLVSKMGTLLALIILCVILTLASDKFLTYSNFVNIIKQASVNCLIASGMLMVLITAGIDLSVGFNCTLAACTMGVLMQRGLTNSFLLLLSALLVSSAIGYINGTLLTRLELPHPFVSTLGMKFVTWGLALYITEATPIGFKNQGVDGILFLGSRTIKGFPISFIAVLVVFTIIHIFLTKTALGRQIYCVGGNLEATRLSGIDSKKVLRIVYTLSGLLCGIAGIILAGRVSTANGNAGMTFDTDAIAACIIGGASFTGGKGTIWGTLIGALLIAVIRNGLNLLGAQTDIQYIIIGLVIIIAVLIDVTRSKAEAKARKMAMANR
ncbi:ABC transporter permease [Faecalicatena contorta]|uniref:Ribose transport system permease protein n=1 Tax=Faecalicatena contorta TaxID=39482 RepID=A0A315ZTH8_9FIRM|nr:ABC transporter permease [Faecalicatena contorta]MBA4698594.1 ABC transporter permease [Ruminococcus sp.]PWJ48866.1 ribose transport system permease protein [Faecalicatena contorta]SUQ14956.1 ribose transport system permease protein [Faecalicatena contorta]